MYYFILFTGHMIDKPGRKEKRFPPELEENVRMAIKKHVSDILTHSDKRLYGIAGGACGGDILFHEVCLDLNIQTTMCLALPPGQFTGTSVSHAGNTWVKRFEALMANLSVEVMHEMDIDSGSFWEAANHWMLNMALQNGGENMILLALWDGKTGDGAGGTGHLVLSAQKENAAVRIIDIKDL
jgi:hypothetical protein